MNLQDNLMLPLLFEVASWHGKVVFRERSDASVADDLARLYELPAEMCEQRHKNGERVFENDVKWARKQMKLEKPPWLGGKERVNYLIMPQTAIAATNP